MNEQNDREISDSPAADARLVMRQCMTATLSTLDRDGVPFGSLVLVACDVDARPLLLMSTLASHTRNAQKDQRVSLLFDGTGGRNVPMTGPRVTVTGILERTNEDRHRQRFLRRHEDAGLYADFEDFGFFILQPEKAHFVAGFGRVNKIGRDDLLEPCPFLPDLEAREQDIVSHMNGDHGDALNAMAAHFAGSVEEGWQMTGLDLSGIDLRLGGQGLRVEYPNKMQGIEQAREFLVNLTKTARSRD